MIYDSLTHVTPDGRWFDTAHNSSVDRLMDNIKKYKVEKAVVSGLPVQDVNDFILELSKVYPDIIYPLPMISRVEIDVLRKQLLDFKNNGVKAIKIHPRLINTSIEDPWFESAINICDSIGLVVFICTVLTGFDLRANSYKIFGKLARKYTNLRFVLLHGGYTDLLKLSEEIRKYENVLLDLSYTITSFYDSSIGLDIKYLFRTFEKRICVGTDFPEYTYDDVNNALEHMNIDINIAIKDGIMGRNLKYFLMDK